MLNIKFEIIMKLFNGKKKFKIKLKKPVNINPIIEYSNMFNISN